LLADGWGPVLGPSALRALIRVLGPSAPVGRLEFVSFTRSSIFTAW
jgi:hypothetical protein